MSDFIDLTEDEEIVDPWDVVSSKTEMIRTNDQFLHGNITRSPFYGQYDRGVKQLQFALGSTLVLIDGQDSIKSPFQEQRSFMTGLIPREEIRSLYDSIMTNNMYYFITVNAMMGSINTYPTGPFPQTRSKTDSGSWMEGNYLELIDKDRMNHFTSYNKLNTLIQKEYTYFHIASKEFGNGHVIQLLSDFLTKKNSNQSNPTVVSFLQKFLQNNKVEKKLAPINYLNRDLKGEIVPYLSVKEQLKLSQLSGVPVVPSGTITFKQFCKMNRRQQDNVRSLIYEEVKDLNKFYALSNGGKEFDIEQVKDVYLLKLPKGLLELEIRGIVSVLPILPDGLTSLICMNKGNYSDIKNMPKLLPPGLRILHCTINNLPFILPKHLEILNCSQSMEHSNKVLHLPQFLKELNCSNCNLNNLPELPQSLQVLHCYSNSLISLPTLPTNLQEFDCNYNMSLQTNVSLPSTLQILKCHYTGVILPTILPPKLQVAYYSDSNITSSTVLPDSLWRLSYVGDATNDPSPFPNLPINLIELYCLNINKIPFNTFLPTSLQIFNCEQCSFVNDLLPPLPSTLKKLDYTRCFTLKGFQSPLPNGLIEVIATQSYLPSPEELPSRLRELVHKMNKKTKLDYEKKIPGLIVHNTE